VTEASGSLDRVDVGQQVGDRVSCEHQRRPPRRSGANWMEAMFDVVLAQRGRVDQ